MRFKNRYLLLELRFSSERDRRHAYSNLTEKSLNQIIKNSILILHGDYGLASVLHSLNVKYLNVSTDIAVLRVPRSRYKEVWSALTLINNINEIQCSINVIYIGGTIRCCQRRLVEHNYDKIKDYVQSATTAVDKRKLMTTIKQVLAKDSVTLKN